MVPTQDRSLSVRLGGSLGVFLLGIFWAAVAFAKLAVIADTLRYGVPFDRVTYVDAFPHSLVLAVIAGEVVVAFLLLAGRAAAGLIAGCVLLTAFSVVLTILPPAPHTPRGCAGELESIVFPAGVSPIARNIFLLGLHGLVLALVTAHSGPAPARSSAIPA